MVFDKLAERLRDRLKKQDATALPEEPAQPAALISGALPAAEEPTAPVATQAEEPAVDAQEKGSLLGRFQKSVQRGIDFLNTDIGELVPAAAPVTQRIDRLKDGLKRTRQSLVGNVLDLFASSRRLDAEFWESLEEILITSDVGVDTSTWLIDHLRKTAKEQRLTEPAALLDVLRSDVGSILAGVEGSFALREQEMTVIMVVGVNGAGKTTTLGKLAHQYQQAGKKVMLAAGDTFRAAAMDQLQVWADRVGCELVRLPEGSDPAAVAYDAVQTARSRGADVLMIDTAGRLHNKANLMEELKKVRRVIDKQLPGAPHETLLVLDSTTGQNALQQARLFNQAVTVTGLALAKLDGTARGGIVIAIARELAIPVRYIGVGEAIDDLRPFVANEFLSALFAVEDEAVESAPA
jgi:fused signal recognition particle receptor